MSGPLKEITNVRKERTESIIYSKRLIRDKKGRYIVKAPGSGLFYLLPARKLQMFYILEGRYWFGLLIAFLGFAMFTDIWWIGLALAILVTAVMEGQYRRLFKGALERLDGFTQKEFDRAREEDYKKNAPAGARLLFGAVVGVLIAILSVINVLDHPDFDMPTKIGNYVLAVATALIGFDGFRKWFISRTRK